MKYKYPDHDLKEDFTPGTYSENNWKLGETACTNRAYYVLPNGSEYAFFKFTTRTVTGKKKVRWEEWCDGRFSNNHFTSSFDEAARRLEGEIKFNGFPGYRQTYRVYI